MQAFATRPEMQDLVRRLALHRRGLAVLHLADLECVAVILGVEPGVVSQARQALATPQGRAELIAAVREAHEEARSGSPAPPARPPAPGPVPRSGRDLVRSAIEHRLGLEFLREGSLESVAVVFHVHPDLVTRARAVLERFESRSARRQGR